MRAAVAFTFHFILYNPPFRVRLRSENQTTMRTSIFPLAAAALAGLLVSGCQTQTGNKIETKFSRGVNNTFELVRMGEFRRSMEQTAVFSGHDAAFSGGFIRGVNRSLAR